MNKRVVMLKWIFFSLMIAVNAFIIYQSCLPEVSSKTWSDSVIDIINIVIDGSIDPEEYIAPTVSVGILVRKIVGHFSLFALDGVVTFLYFFFLDKDKQFTKRWIYLIPSFSIGVLLAIVTESLQLIIPGRVGGVVDALIDIGGYLFGAGITYLIVYLVNRHQKQKQLAETDTNK